jgi:hypothetical protein
MHEIMITCPETGKAISTGVFSDSKSLALTPFFVSHVQCPACGGQHSWSKSDAWLRDRAAPRQRSEVSLMRQTQTETW